MVSLWQRLFNVLILIFVLYFFWLTANYRAMWEARLKIDAAYSVLSDVINNMESEK